MNKISKLLKGIKALMLKPSLINLILNDEEQWENKLSNTKNFVDGFPVISFKTLFPGFQEDVQMCFLDGSSLPTDFALIKGLCKKFNDCKYFEIGTWRGESVINAASVTEDCTTFNLSKEEIIDLGFGEKYAGLHGILSKKNRNILHIEGNSLTYDFASLNKKYDVIFIDGDHHYENVKHDTEKIFQHLVHKNSIVIWHDYAYAPEKIRWEVARAIADGVPEKFHQNLFHVENTMCAIFIQDNFSTSKLQPPINPKYIFDVHLSLNKIN